MLVTNKITYELYLAAALPWVGDYQKAFDIVALVRKLLPDPGGIHYGSTVLAGASAHIDSGQFDTLQKEFQKALRIYEGNWELVEKEFRYYYCYSSQVCQQSFSWLGRKGNEKEYLDKIMPYIDQHGFLDLKCYNYYLKGQTHALCGRVKEAEKMHEEFLIYSKKLGRPGIYEVYFNQRIARMYLESGRLQEAEQAIERGSAIADELEYPLLMMSFAIIKGELSVERKKYDLAEEHFQKARKINGEKIYCEYPRLLYLWAKLYMALRNFDKADKMLSEAHDILHHTFCATNSIYHIELYIIMASLNIINKNYEKAEKLLKDAYSIALEEYNTIQKGVIQSWQAYLYNVLQQGTLSKQYFDQGCKEFDAIANDFQKQRAHALFEGKINT